jgi:ABC-type polar amino acid transport system ATPase subunit
LHRAAAAVETGLILMDEPCSALDVEGTPRIEELMFELKGRYTIVIVTHNMAQARRASDECIFMLMGESRGAHAHHGHVRHAKESKDSGIYRGALWLSKWFCYKLLRRRNETKHETENPGRR